MGFSIISFNRFSVPRAVQPILAALVALVCLFAATGAHATAYDNYVWLADAWLHHRLWIHFPGDFIDAIPYHGRAYIVEAPMPGILMLPLVAVQGTDANQTIVAVLTGAVGIGACWQLSRNLGLGVAPSIVLCAFMLFGTSYYFCAVFGDVWFFAHVSAAAFSLLALAELTGPRRGWLVGVWAIAAAFSRYPLLVTLPIYAFLLWNERRSLESLRGFAIVCVAAFLPWVLYNEGRWGTAWDRGFSLFYTVMDPRSASGQPAFGLVHTQMQLWAFFQRPPHWFTAYPWMAPGQFGTAITYTSPGLLGILRADLRSRFALGFWVMLLVTAIPSFLYYDTGGYQYGTRHALDFEPYAIALLALALQRPYPAWIYALLAWSIAFGAYAMYVWLNAHFFVT